MLWAGVAACHRYGECTGLCVERDCRTATRLPDDGRRPKHVGASQSDF